MTSEWAPEIVIKGPNPNFPDNKVLLTVYDGGIEEYRGRWHIPGGYGGVGDEKFEAACSRIALKEIGMDVQVMGTFPHPYLWLPGEHPYGRPLSIYTLVRPKGVIEETNTRRFFWRHELPDNLLEVHRKFIDQFIFP